MAQAQYLSDNGKNYKTLEEAEEADSLHAQLKLKNDVSAKILRDAAGLITVIPGIKVNSRILADSIASNPSGWLTLVEQVNTWINTTPTT